MNTLVAEPVVSDAIEVHVTDEEIIVSLLDGRTIAIPVEWYPRLLHASTEERLEWELIGDGEGIHWPQIDEDVQVSALIYGLPSCETQESLQRWLQTRK